MVDLRRQVRGLASFANRVGATPIGLSGRYRLLATPENGPPRSSSAALQRALTPDAAAKTVADAIVCPPRRLRPAFSQVLALTEAVSPRSMDRVRKRYT